MRIAHLSDPHLLALEGTPVTAFFNKRWMGGLNLLVKRAREHRPEVFRALVDDVNDASVDHVLCTGDITNLALESEMRFARECFDRFVQGPADVTVIPGNHDAYVEEGVELFNSYFRDLFESDAPRRRRDGLWPTVRVRGRVAIVCVSTSLPTAWGSAYGEVGSRQLARLEEVLTDPTLGDKFRLVAIHHPPAGPPSRSRSGGLRDHARFAAAMRQCGAELVLHGHEHADLLSHLATPDGDVAVRGIQSATYAGHKPEELAHYRIYEIADAQPRPRLVGEELRAWNKARGAFEREQVISRPP